MNDPVSMVDVIDQHKSSTPPSYSDLLRENAELKEQIKGMQAALDQIKWERNLAIDQLREDYDVGLGEKKRLVTGNFRVPPKDEYVKRFATPKQLAGFIARKMKKSDGV